VEELTSTPGGLSSDRGLLMGVLPSPRGYLASTEPQSILWIPSPFTPPAIEEKNHPIEVKPVDLAQIRASDVLKLSGQLWRDLFVSVEV
jgi:hypothetical protein